MDKQFRNMVSLLKNALLPIAEEGVFAGFPPGTIIFGTAVHYPGTVTMVKGQDEKWKLFRSNGFQVIEEDDLEPEVPALLILLGN